MPRTNRAHRRAPTNPDAPQPPAEPTPASAEPQHPAGPLEPGNAGLSGKHGHFAAETGPPKNVDARAVDAPPKAANPPAKAAPPKAQPLFSTCQRTELNALPIFRLKQTDCKDDKAEVRSKRSETPNERTGMPSLAPYIPPKDASLNNWLANFSSLLTASPATYGLMSADASTIAAAVAAWTSAYDLVTSPATKTAATVSAKNTEKVIVLATVRPYAQTIANNAGVTSANKVALGLNPKTSVPVPITAPTTMPILTAQSTSTAGTIIRYRDSTASPSVKSKPYGVTSVQLFAKASATPITDPTTLTFIEAATKSPLTVAMGSPSAGMTVYFAARWQTRKGLVGPWSPIISYVVAG
jgi:hypothetical protein